MKFTELTKENSGRLGQVVYVGENDANGGVLRRGVVYTIFSRAEYCIYLQGYKYSYETTDFRFVEFEVGDEVSFRTPACIFEVGNSVTITDVYDRKIQWNCCQDGTPHSGLIKHIYSVDLNKYMNQTQTAPVANTKKWVAPSVAPKRASNGRFASNKPAKLRYGSIYRVQERDRHYTARLRQHTISENVVVDILGKPICVPAKKLRVATKEEVDSYLERARAKSATASK